MYKEAMSNNLILCPGLLCDPALWRAQIDGLQDCATLRVADFTTDDSITAMAERVLGTAQDTFALAGLSMGGYVAQEIVRQAPERVSRLALLDTSARIDSETVSRRRQDFIALAGRGRFRGVTPKLMPLLVHPERLDDTDLTNDIQAMADASVATLSSGNKRRFRRGSMGARIFGVLPVRHWFSAGGRTN